MEFWVLVFIGCLFFMLGVRVYHLEKRNTIFNKRSIMVRDVAKYNHACGFLIMGYSILALFTIGGMIYAEGIASTIFTILIIAISIGVSLLYNQIEKRHIKK